MVIKYREQYENKTSEYLSPCLKEGYSRIFEVKFKEMFVLAYGIGDKVIEENPNFIIGNKSPIFILIDTFANKRKSEDFIYWIRYQDYYIYDYIADMEGRGHMIILDFPKKYKNAYDKFLEGKYSEMFTKEEILKLFKEDSKEYKVLTKNKLLLPDFTNKLRKIFDLKNLSDRDLEDSELELPYTMNLKEEIFNS
jgi:hypothetical protein